MPDILKTNSLLTYLSLFQNYVVYLCSYNGSVGFSPFCRKISRDKTHIKPFPTHPHTSYAKHNPEISHHQATKKKLSSLNIRNKYVFAITAMVHSGTRKAEEISCFIHSHKSTTIDENRKSLLPHAKKITI